MADNTQAEFTWRGRETVDGVLASLTPPARIEIVLPANYNHALFVQLHPEADAAQPEELNLEGDVTLLREIARVRGLEALADLVGPLSTLNAVVAVLSPPRILITLG